MTYVCNEARLVLSIADCLQSVDLPHDSVSEGSKENKVILAHQQSFRARAPYEAPSGPLSLRKIPLQLVSIFQGNLLAGPTIGRKMTFLAPGTTLSSTVSDAQQLFTKAKQGSDV